MAHIAAVWGLADAVAIATDCVGTTYVLLQTRIPGVVRAYDVGTLVRVDAL